MEKEPLLPYISPRRPNPSPPTPSLLCPLPEDTEITLPIPSPLTHSELKDRLIFGDYTADSSSSSSSSSSTTATATATAVATTSSLVDALTLSLNSPRNNNSFINPSDPFPTPDSPNPFNQSWLLDPNYCWPTQHFRGPRIEKEPLLPYISPRRPNPSPPTPSLLCPLPEDTEITLPIPSPLTPSELKDRLIFGDYTADSSSSTTATAAATTSSLVDALTLALNSPRNNNSFINPSVPSPTPDSPNPFNQSWLLDPSYCYTKTNLHRSKTAPAMVVIKDLYRTHDEPKPPQFASSSIVRQAFGLLILYLALGVVIYWFNRHNFKATQTHPVVDALYFCIVTMCTIGYGDITPDSAATKIFSIMFVLVGFGFIDILLSGMVSYVLDLQENYLLRSLKEGGGWRGDEKSSVIFDVKKGRMRIRMKVALALGVVVLCIGIGVAVMHFVEKLGWLDAFYLSVMSVTTVGYGDRAFNSMVGRLFASIWLLVSTLAVARAFLYLAEARVDKRHRRMAKWVLGQNMTVSQFLAADIDNNGFVSKSEYVIYKLKEMGKVSEKDILQICKIFEKIDAGNFGKITLADLMENHH